MKAPKSSPSPRKRVKRNPEPKPALEPATVSPSPALNRVLVVDDHPMTRMGITHLLETLPDLTVCCEASTAPEALSLITSCKPDLIISDLTIPGRGGPEFIRDVKSLAPTLPVLVLSMHDEKLHAERVLRAGARGYIMKEAGSMELIKALRRVLDGQVYVSESMSARIIGCFSERRPRGSSSPIKNLSDREFEVFWLIGEGHSTSQIAERLHLSPKTIDVHRSHIKEKLAINDINGLIRHAVRWVEIELQQPHPDPLP